jgi:hypothetical protein
MRARGRIDAGSGEELVYERDFPSRADASTFAA